MHACMGNQAIHMHGAASTIKGSTHSHYCKSQSQQLRCKSPMRACIVGQPCNCTTSSLATWLPHAIYEHEYMAEAHGWAAHNLAIVPQSPIGKARAVPTRAVLECSLCQHLLLLPLLVQCCRCWCEESSPNTACMHAQHCHRTYDLFTKDMSHDKRLSCMTDWMDAGAPYMHQHAAL
jgi:hypothetical protein